MFGVEQRHAENQTKSGKIEESDRKMGERKETDNNNNKMTVNRSHSTENTTSDVFSIIKAEHNGDKKYKQNIITE